VTAPRAGVGASGGPTAIAPGIARVGSELVNAYLLVDGGEVTVIDAGAPAYWGALLRALAGLGRSLEDVRALLLTHGHRDHLGFAERLRRERGIVARIHAADVALARGMAPDPARNVGPMRPLPIIRLLAWAARNGALRQPRLVEVSTFGDGDTLDVPGAPRIIAVPGHTPGSVAFHVPGHDAVFVGDALVTYAASSGGRGPRISPFTADRALAVASLERLREVEARLVLPGHGAAWTQGARSAVEAAVASEAGAGR
jgi:glyoxylase-like metal-dependent hydrolase (beta-lactamase superfamily II)